MYELSAASVRSTATTAMNDAALEVLSWNGADYDSLVHIQRDGQGNVLSMEADAQGINLLARQTVSVSMSKLSAACNAGVKVPLGVFSGIGILSGFGPKVTFKTALEGSVDCKPLSKFVSAGINQTLHAISLRITATVQLILPTGNKDVFVETEMLVSECVIVGKIPDMYLNGNLFG